MSANKGKYFTVTTTAVVRANNKTDALALARGRRGITGQVLQLESEVENITASTARTMGTSA